MSYEFAIERGEDTVEEMLPLYRAHHAEMRERLARDGIAIGEFAPRADVYLDYWRRGFLVHYVVRHGGKAVGYANIYVTDDQHDGAPIASDDAIFVTPAHRNGAGRSLVRFVLEDLRRRGVRRFNMAATTDPRAAKLFERLGFRPFSQILTFSFS